MRFRHGDALIWLFPAGPAAATVCVGRLFYRALQTIDAPGSFFDDACQRQKSLSGAVSPIEVYQDGKAQRQRQQCLMRAMLRAAPARDVTDDDACAASLPSPAGRGAHGLRCRLKGDIFFTCRLTGLASGRFRL